MSSKKNQFSDNMNKLSGYVERVTFHNPDNGFCVLKLKVTGKEELITVIGTAISINPGEQMECQGSWVKNQEHGMQFKATALKSIRPNSIAGIERYLGSGVVKGIGAGLAKRMVQKFGIDIFDIIENYPEKLTQIEGFAEKRCKQIVAAWVDQKIIRNIMVFLHEHGIGTARAVRIYKTYGQKAITKIQENPYCLATDIRGIGFKTADALSVRLGISQTSLIRAVSGVQHVLYEASSIGHCGAQYQSLIEDSVKLLDISKEIIEEAIKVQLAEGTLIQDTVEEEAVLFLPNFYHAEISVAKHLATLLSTESLITGLQADKAINWVEAKNHIQLSFSQKRAVLKAIDSKVMIITGGPGVGKTTILNSILNIFKIKTDNILLCAPTGRAAKRLTESTGITAKTIHRLLEFDARERSFRKNDKTPLVAQLIVIDEASMIDILMMNHLLKAIPKECRVIFVGDIDQLPSVGAGMVLANMIDSDVIPTVRLTEVFRQARTSKIITNAHLVNQGIIPKIDDSSAILTDFYFIKADTPEVIQEKLCHIITKRIPHTFKLDAVKDIQVLTPMNRGSLGAHALNVLLKERLNPSVSHSIMRYGTTFSTGDKVMQTSNNYDKDVYNGDIGFIDSIDHENGSLLIHFDNRSIGYEFDELDELSLAYASTIHKAQGSEYPAVVIPLAMQHFMLLERNLIYTAMTRGRKLVIIIGQMKAFAMAIKNIKSHQRMTNLTYRLQISC